MFQDGKSKSLLFRFEQVLEIGKGFVFCPFIFFIPDNSTPAFYLVQIPPVLVLMAIDTEILPVAPVPGVVVVIVIPVMDGKEMGVFLVKFPATPCADPGMDFQGLLPVITLPFFP